MLLVPDAGAELNVKVVLDTEYVDLAWYTPDTYTKVKFSEAGAVAKVKAVVDPLPENTSTVTVACVLTKGTQADPEYVKGVSLLVLK